MAITINQAPSHPTMANSPLVFSVSSTQYSQPQFQYVADIKDGNGTLIQRVKQQPNPSGIGVFDLSSIIKQQFDGDIDSVPEEWYSNPIYENPDGEWSTSNELTDILNQKYIIGYKNGGELKEFQVLFGEEYSTSYTATASLYDGNGSLGSPAVSSSDNWQTYTAGVLNKNDKWPKWDSHWDLRSIYDSYYDYPVPFSPLLTMIKGKGKWVPQQYWGYSYVYEQPPLGNVTNQNYYADVKNFPQETMPMYQLNIGLTDFPISRSVHWSDTMDLSVLSGTETPPEKMADWYLPKAQWVWEGLVQFNYSDGSSQTANMPLFRDWWASGSFSIRNMKWHIFNSQSIENQLLHIPVGPQQFSGWNGAFRNPVEYPTRYVESYDVSIWGFQWGLGHCFSGMGVAGRENPVTYEPAEKGGVGYSIPIIVMDGTETFTTGSYPSSTATTTLVDATGNTALIHFSQSDALYPTTGFPIATPYQIQSDINEQCEAQGCDVRCYFIDNENYGNLADEVKTIPGSQYYLLLTMGDRADNTAISNTLVGVAEATGSTEVDAFGTKIVGLGSCTGLPTGQFGYDSNNMNYAYFSGEGYEDYVYALWDKRHYEVDWSGFSRGYNSSTGQWDYAEAVACGGYNAKQFAWKNKYGVDDYYTFTLAETITDDIERNSYEQNFVDYSTNTTTIDFNKSRRGNTQFYNKITQRHVIESDWLTQDEADAVREMFFSTDVNVLEKQSLSNANERDYLFGFARNPDFANLEAPLSDANGNNPAFITRKVPVVITNATLTEKTNPRTQKLYKISAEFVYANDLNARV